VVRIEPFLLDDEQLLASCGTGQGLVCATDLRLLRVERSVAGRRIRDLSYAEVTSVEVAERISWWLAGLGILAAGVGVLLPRLVAGALSLANPTQPMRLTPAGEQSIWLVGAVLVAIGGMLLGLGLFRRRPWVELHGPGLLRARRQRRAWRFVTPTPSDARVFAMLVRQRLAERGRVDEKKVLPFDTV
jgi:hypothetical protein